MTPLLLALSPLALAWDHNGTAHTEPLLLEVTTTDAGGAPPGAVQQAIADAVDDWTDDACLESLDVQLGSTSDNIEQTDGRSLVSVDTDDQGFAAVTYIRPDGHAFERFGDDYLSVLEVDITMGPATWALPEDVDAGSCPGPVLEHYAWQMVGFALGLTRPLDPAADSLYNLPDCSHPALGDDDRAGLRALYGSGVEVSCVAEQTVSIGFDELHPSDTLCEVGTYGESELLDLWWEDADGNEASEPEALVWTEPGWHSAAVCGQFDVAAGCERDVVCVDDPVQYLVCATPTPTLTWTVDGDTLRVSDTTTLTDEACIGQRRWVLRTPGGEEEVVADEREATLDVPDAASAELSLELSLLDTHYFVTSETVVFEDDSSPTGEDASEDPSAGGCGCVAGGVPAVPALLLLVSLVLVRRSEDQG